METQMTGTQKTWAIILSSFFLASAIGTGMGGGGRPLTPEEKIAQIRANALDNCIFKAHITSMTPTEETKKLIEACGNSVKTSVGNAAH